MARKIAQNGALTPRMAGTLRKDSQNVEQVNSNRGKNRFDLSHSHYMSMRFGEVRPFFYQQCVPEDTISHSNNSELWSMQMKSPLMANLVGFKDYFYIPMKAILPNTWELWYTNPVQGDDIPNDAYCNVDLAPMFNATTQVYEDLKKIIQSINTETGGNAGTVASRYGTALMVKLKLMYHIITSNSILCQLGLNTNTFYELITTDPQGVLEKLNIDRTQKYSIDSIIERAVALPISVLDAELSDYITAEGDIVITNTKNRKVYVLVSNGSFNRGIYRELYQDVLRNVDSATDRPLPTYTISKGLVNGNLAAGSSLLVFALLALPYRFALRAFTTASSMEFDISPVIAYQMVGAQFYVNDQVDKIFTAETWLKTFDYKGTLNNAEASFNYNGIYYNYDVFSRRIFSELVQDFSGSITTEYDSIEVFGGYFLNLFAPYESLRYGDYFVGSRLNPLALGADPNSYAPVTANNVKSLDMVQAMAYLNYYNDIQKLGPTAWIQQNGIFGDFPSSLDPMPRFIQRSKFSIGEMQIENTSDNNTGDVVTRGRSNDSGQFFGCAIDEPSIVIGLLSFDCPRIYSNVVDRLAFVKDRFDVFQPYFQNIGDQPILAKELNLQADSESVWSWTIRHTEYKQRISYATGAFVGDSFLPSWAFVKDDRDLQLVPKDIRNHNEDLDKYFVTLPNVTNAGYFHFYVRMYNRCEIVRAMQDRPDIQTPKIHQ